MTEAQSLKSQLCNTTIACLAFAVGVWLGNVGADLRATVLITGLFGLPAFAGWMYMAGKTSEK